MRFKDIQNVRTGNLFIVPIDLLNEEPGFNVRNYDAPDVKAQIRSFADSYKAGKYVSPLAVRLAGEKLFIVEGHLRTRGAKLAVSEGAEIAGLSCTHFTGSDSDRTVFMVTSSQGLALDPIGRASAYLRLRNMGLSDEMIAEKVGRTATHVGQYLTLASANGDVQRAVERGEVSASLAIEIVSKHGDSAGKFIAETLKSATAAAATKAAAKPVRKARATTKAKPVKVVKVTRKALGGSPQKALIAAALKLCEKHAALLDGKRADVLKTTVMVSAADLLALFDALPAKAKAKKIASA